MPANPSPARSELLESIHQWNSAIRYFTRSAPLLERPALHGLNVYWANVMLPVYNIGLLSSPCTDVEDLRGRVEPLQAFAAERGKPWFFTPADAWLPEGAGDVLASLGLVEAMRLTGMVATDLTPPSREVAGEIRQLGGREGAVAMGRLNCAGYGMPLEWAEETDWAAFFGPDVFSYAMREDGIDVSTATVFVIEDCLNVVGVATLPEFQRKGYAETVMRHALQQASQATGLTRTVLHASDAGRPLYERMGYRAVTGFGAWTPAHA